MPAHTPLRAITHAGLPVMSTGHLRARLLMATTRTMSPAAIGYPLAAGRPRTGRTGGAVLPTAAGPADHHRRWPRPVRTAWATVTP